MARRTKIHVGLEIGTSKTCMVVGEVKADSAVKILGIGETKSAGVRKGEIYDYSQARACLKDALAKAEDASDVEIGSVFLAVTGAEALYADLGHFGRGPIQTAWLIVALPALTINYLGQGSLLLLNPQAIENPFFLLGPDWLRLPMVILATCATVIASQALISGAFSVTRQCMQLGFFPRMTVLHTSNTEEGQIYIPQVNLILAAGVLLLVFAGGGHALAASGRSSVALAPSRTATPIEHVIVLMQEGHSFDNYFGTYPGPDGIP